MLKRLLLVAMVGCVGARYGAGQQAKADAGATGTLVRTDNVTLTLTLPEKNGATKKLSLYDFEFEGASVSTDKLHLKQLSPGVIEITSVAYTVGDWRFRLRDDANYYGLGERFDTLNHAHTVVKNVVQDVSGAKGSSTPRPVPFFMSTTGYGLWFDMTTDATFDMNASSKQDVIVDGEAEKLRVVLFAGPEFPTVLDGFTALHGRDVDKANTPVLAASDRQASFSAENGLSSLLTAEMNAGLSGMPLGAADLRAEDMGGYLNHGALDAKLFMRWAEYEAFSPVMETVPEADLLRLKYGDQALAVYRKLSRLHASLSPYRSAAAQVAAKTGTPIMRALVLEYQEDEQARTALNEYMFGPDLLVAPVVDEGTQRVVYLPAGEWVDYWTGVEIAGGKTIVAEAAVDSIPLYVKHGAVLPKLPEDVVSLGDKSAKAMDDQRVYEVFGTAASSASTTLDFEGRTVVRSGNSLTIKGDAKARVIVRWRFGKVQSATVDGAMVKVQGDATGAFVEFDYAGQSAVVW